ncbi:MAG: DUF3520 domain-containing protein [bacterium]|nr:DUF3520 domain-containing protein [bacterium]
MKKLISLAMFIVFCFGVSFAQNHTGTINGTFVLEDGRLIPGVKVTLKSTNAASKTTVSNEKGEFHFKFIPPGTYQINYEVEKYITDLNKTKSFIFKEKNGEFYVTTRPLSKYLLTYGEDRFKKGFRKNIVLKAGKTINLKLLMDETKKKSLPEGKVYFQDDELSTAPYWIRDLINYFSYDYPQPKDERPFAIFTELSKCPWNKKHLLLHIGLQGKEIENQQDSNLVLLLYIFLQGDFVKRVPYSKHQDGVFANEAQKIWSNYYNACRDFHRTYKTALNNLVNNGNNRFVLDSRYSEAKKIFCNEMSLFISTIASNVSMKTEINPAKVKACRLVNREGHQISGFAIGELRAGEKETFLFEITPGTLSEKDVKKMDLKNKYVNASKTDSHELMTLKFRCNGYGTVTKVVTDRIVKLEDTSINFRFSAAVAEFGLIHKRSKFKGSASFDNVLKLAKGAIGKDEYGFRDVFCRLVECMREKCKYFKR